MKAPVVRLDGPITVPDATPVFTPSSFVCAIEVASVCAGAAAISTR